MKRPLDIKFTLIATGLGALLLLLGFGGRAVYLRNTGLRNARAHANAAFQGERVKTSVSCIGYWRQEVASGAHFEVYMESSNGWGIEPADFTYVAIKTSDNKRYERVEHFDYAEARAYGDSPSEFMPLWNDAKSAEEKRDAVQDRVRAWSKHPGVAKILRLRLVSTLGELDDLMTELGFAKL